MTTPLPPQTPDRAPLETIDPRLTTIQPGGGVCMRFELAWGSLRRAVLQAVWPKYVARMAALRKGKDAYYPHPILDPRDLKFYQNRDGFYWAPEHDPFAWRDRLPVVRAGLMELVLIGGGLAALAIVVGWWYWPAAAVPAILAGLVAWFFRNPRRTVPSEPGTVVSPADGRIVDLVELEHDDFLNSPAVRIGIFLSVFNVHINRVPLAVRVIGLRYAPGKFLNALLPRSARENEQLEVRLEENRAPFRRMIVRQIAGAIARRIVCWVKPGDELAAGAQFGMIKFGSRTELVLPRDSELMIAARVGQRVRAGETVLARYRPAPPNASGMSGAAAE